MKKIVVRSNNFPAAGFTLIELILVITIIGILLAFLIVDFASVRAKQQLTLMADQALALMQQARGEVSAGKVRTETSLGRLGLESNKIYLCEGGYFEQESVPVFTRGDYDPRSQSCDFNTFATEPYGLSTGEAHMAELTVGGSGVEAFWAIYWPPDGELVFYSENGDLLSGGALVHFDHPNESDLDVSLELSAQTDLVSLSLGSDEE